MNSLPISTPLPHYDEEYTKALQEYQPKEKKTMKKTEQRPQECFRFHNGHCPFAVKEINLPNGETIYYAKCDPYCEYFIPKPDKQ